MSPKAKAAMTTLAIAAVERLSDPEVRAKLAEQGRHLADQVVEWNRQRTADPDRRRSRRLRRIEERAAKLRATMDQLATGRPEIAAALVETRALLDEIDVAVGVAQGLPKDKRRQAATRLDAELERLEQGVLDLSLPSAG